MGDWNESLTLRCWYSVEGDGYVGTNYVTVHLSETTPTLDAKPKTMLRVRRLLTEDRTLTEHVALAREGMARVLREIADNIHEGVFQEHTTCVTQEPDADVELPCPLGERTCCQNEPCKYPNVRQAALTGTPWRDEPPEETDDDGYPTDAFLEWLAHTKQHARALELACDYIGERTCGSATEMIDDEPFLGRVDRIAISTGGWSGCEDVMGALESNRVFWLMHWQSLRCGGHYVLDKACSVCSVKE